LDKEFSFSLFDKLFDKLKDQDLIKKNIIDLLDIWYKTKNKSISFLLIGDSFVGKTLTIQIVYEILKNLSYKLIIIDNNNYENIIIEDNSIIVFENIEVIEQNLWKKFLFLFKDDNEYNNIIFLTSNRKIDEIENDFLDFEFQNKIRKMFTEINKNVFMNIDYFLPYKNISKTIKYQIIKDEISKNVREYGLNLIDIDENFINKYLKQDINSNNIKDIKNNIKYTVSNIIIKLKKENPEIKNIRI
jgi:ATP-dependent Clp protease ATP-binding subunit ClpA